MQYTLRRVPEVVDRALRKLARERGKSLNEVALEAMATGLGMEGQPTIRRRDLSDIAGSWISDPEVDQALSDQREIDPEMWK